MNQQSKSEIALQKQVDELKAVIREMEAQVIRAFVATVAARQAGVAQ